MSDKLPYYLRLRPYNFHRCKNLHIDKNKLISYQLLVGSYKPYYGDFYEKRIEYDYKIKKEIKELLIDDIEKLRGYFSRNFYPTFRGDCNSPKIWNERFTYDVLCTFL